MSSADKKTLAEGLEANVKAGINVAVEEALKKTDGKVKALSTQISKQAETTSADIKGMKEELKALSKTPKIDAMEQNMAKMMAMIQGLANPNANPNSPTTPEVQPPPAQQPQAQQQPQSSDSKKTSRVNTAFKPEELNLDFTLAAFKTWKARFNDYFRMNEMENLPQENQAAHIRSCISMKTQDHLRIFMAMKPESKCAEILELLEKYFTGQSNVTSRRVEFSNCKQRSSETFEQFFVRLSLLQEDSDPCQACQEMQLVTRVIAGVSDSELRQKLLQLKEPKVAEIKDLCQAWELSRKDDRQLGDRGRQNKVSSYKQRGRSPSQDKSDRSRAASSERSKVMKGCPQCFTTHQRRDCPHKNTTCNNCQRKGHLKSVCLSRAAPRDGDKSKSNTVRVRNVKAGAPSIEVQAECQGKAFEEMALPDSGADDTLIGKKFLERHGEFNYKKTFRRLMAANNSEMRCCGTIHLKVKFYSRTIHVKAFVTPDIDDFLLSWKASKALGLLSPDYPIPGYVTDSKTCMVKESSAEPSEEEIKRVRSQLMEEFRDVFNPQEEFLPAMDGKPMSIHLVEDYKPSTVTVARPIAFAYRDQMKQYLDKLVERKLIEPANDEPTEWCSPMHVVPKKNGDPRMVIDYTKLNAFVKRPVHPFQSPRDAVSDIPRDAQWFTTMDATSGYWQIPLDAEAQKICTFLTPFGRFKPLRGPMGLVSTGDEYCQRGDQAFAGIPKRRKIVDDTLLFGGNSFQEHLEQVRSVLERCRRHKMTMNPEKFEFGKREVEFCGYIVGRAGIAANPRRVQAIQEFPKPENLTDLRSFMGLVNQLGEFSSEISAAAEQLRPLMKSKTVYQWLPEHDEAFGKVKAALVAPPVLVPFDPKLPTLLRTDASRLKGLGYALLQDHGGKGTSAWRLVQCGSRFTSDTESRYSMVELELLAVVWATLKCKLFLQGLQCYSLETDHKPLLPILNDYQLQAIETPRIQRLREKLVPYNFKAAWVPGKMNLIADALSRSPVDKPNEEDFHAEFDSTQASLYRRITTVDEEKEFTSDPALELLAQSAKEDDSYQKLLNSIQEEEFSKDPAVLPYKKLLPHLSVHDGLVLYGARIIIPRASRRDILRQLHVPHQGIERSKQRARQLFYWPGMNADIQSSVEACELCQFYQASQPKESFRRAEQPSRPFEHVSADLFSYNNQEYMVYVDRFSGWPTVEHFGQSPTSSKVIKALKKIFKDTGVPLCFASDGGLQFTSQEFREFCQDWNIVHRLSSPEYPQSNGHAEAAVKAMKNLVKKCTHNGHLNADEFNEALLEWRNTPRSKDGRSPAQVLFGKPMRTRLPIHYNAFSSEHQVSALQCDLKATELLHDQEERYNESARDLPELPVGTPVRVQSQHGRKEWDRIGQVVAVHPNRKYDVKLPSGRVLTRNRRHIRPVPGASKEVESTEEFSLKKPGALKEFNVKPSALKEFSTKTFDRSREFKTEKSKKRVTFGKNNVKEVPRLPKDYFGNLEPRRSSRCNKGKKPKRLYQ